MRTPLSECISLSPRAHYLNEQLCILNGNSGWTRPGVMISLAVVACFLAGVMFNLINVKLWWVNVVEVCFM